MNDIAFSNSFWLNEFTFTKFHYTDNRHGAKVHYIGYMKEGYVELRSTDRTVTVKKGEFLYIPKKCCYESFWYGDPTVQFYSFGFEHSPVPEKSALPLQRIDATEETVALSHKINTGRNVDCLSVGYVYQLLGLLMPQMTEYDPTPKEKLVNTAIQYMKTCRVFTVRDVAEHCNVSESGLYAAFRKVTGKTPIDTKNEILAEKTMALITSTDMTLDAICAELGFSSVSYMRRIFRDRYKMTPKEARKESSTRLI